VSASESRQRSKLVGLRLLPQEHRALKVEADRQGITVPTLILNRLRLDDPDLVAAGDTQLV
jgi:predicted HicB family RNase H-like nuclease